MTLESFKSTVVSIAIILASQGLPSTLEDIIMWNGDWHHKYAESKKGRFDA